MLWHILMEKKKKKTILHVNPKILDLAILPFDTETHEKARLPGGEIIVFPWLS